jgi:hypothetical protein
MARDAVGVPLRAASGLKALSGTGVLRWRVVLWVPLVPLPSWCDIASSCCDESAAPHGVMFELLTERC